MSAKHQEPAEWLTVGHRELQTKHSDEKLQREANSITALALYRRLARLFEIECSGTLLLFGEHQEALYLKLRSAFLQALRGSEFPDLVQDLEEQGLPETLLGMGDEVEDWWDFGGKQAVAKNKAKLLSRCIKLGLNPFDPAVDQALFSVDEALARYERSKQAAEERFWQRSEREAGAATMPQETKPGAPCERIEQTPKPMDRPPWEAIPEGWEREAVRLWWEGLDKGEIAQRLDKDAKTVENRFSQLRRDFGEAVVPYSKRCKRSSSESRE